MSHGAGRVPAPHAALLAGAQHLPDLVLPDLVLPARVTATGGAAEAGSALSAIERAHLTRPGRHAAGAREPQQGRRSRARAAAGAG